MTNVGKSDARIERVLVVISGLVSGYQTWRMIALELEDAVVVGDAREVSKTVVKLAAWASVGRMK